MSFQVIDFALLLVSITACGYCAVLSRRLKALQDTKDGLGATIMALSKSISAVSATSDEARFNASDLAMRLANLMKDAEARCETLQKTALTLDAQSDKITAQAAELNDRADRARSELTALMADVEEQSEARMVEITKVMRRHVLDSQNELTGALKDAVGQSKVQIREMQALLAQLKSFEPAAPAETRATATALAPHGNPTFRRR